ncbi:Protein RESISTANCE TO PHYTOPHTHORA 1 [Cardamine amara subsp. amara]|uniref:Protein RESISTANCE TO PHYTOPHTHORA 1 n=1 Tax=Cardamine amara subsp. amara TaxID=228776 RepID=A0ABD1CAN8_CARAN
MMRLCLLSPSLSNLGLKEMMRLCLLSPSLCTHGLSSLHPWNSNLRTFQICATADGDEPTNGLDIQPPDSPFPSSSPSALSKDLKKVVNKTAATFAPRASTASKNPAVPGSTLYKVFEVQGYASMFLGGVLSFNLLFPSNEPDLWRLMGMWSIWMFTIPSLRARDCPSKEKEALNYLFLIVPLLNVAIPFFWKSFALVWSADTLAFFAMYAWKLGWLESTESGSD